MDYPNEIFRKNSLDSIDEADLTDLIDRGVTEGLRFECKSDFPSGGLGKHVSAFANTGGGFLLLGATTDKSTNESMASPDSHRTLGSAIRSTRWSGAGSDRYPFMNSLSSS